MKPKKPKKKIELDGAGHGGAREGAGRHKTDTVQVTCMLRRDTIDELRRAGGRRWGEYLQKHLDAHPIDPNAELRSNLRLLSWIFTGDDTGKTKPGKPVANSRGQRRQRAAA